MNEERDQREKEWRMRLIDGKLSTAEIVEKYLADLDDNRAFIRNSAAKMLGRILILEDVPNADAIVARLIKECDKPSGPEGLGEDEEFYYDKTITMEAIEKAEEFELTRAQGASYRDSRREILKKLSHATGGYSAVGYDSTPYHAAQALYEYAASKPGNPHVLRIVRLFFEDCMEMDGIFEAWRKDFDAETMELILEKNAGTAVGKDLLDYFAGHLIWEYNDELALKAIAALLENNPSLIDQREDIANAILEKEDTDGDMEGYLLDISQVLLYRVPKAEEKVLEYLKRRSADERRGIREVAREILREFGTCSREMGSKGLGKKCPDAKLHTSGRKLSRG